LKRDPFVAAVANETPSPHAALLLYLFEGYEFAKTLSENVER
jgi:hypothetical protein